MIGIVTCIKHEADNNDSYFVIGEHGKPCQLKSNVIAYCGDAVEYEKSITKVIADKKSHCAENADAFASSTIASFIEKDAYRTGNKEIDNITEKMWNGLSAAARLLLRKLLYSAPIIIRFHNDADGSGGGCSLYLSVSDFCSKTKSQPNTVWLMHKKIAYGIYDAESDIAIANNYRSAEKPLLVIIDFGTTTDSNMGIEKVKDKFDVIWLDHHPIQEGFGGLNVGYYINPWNFGGDSNYTAGLLSSIMCRTFSSLNTNEYAQASLIGDYSNYANLSNQEISTILDFITSDASSIYGNMKMNITPQEMVAVIEDRKRRREVLNYAQSRMEEAIDNGKKYVKRYSSESVGLYVLNFEKIRSEETKYPLPGRFASKLLDAIYGSGDKNAVLIVHAGPYISMRMSKEAGAKKDLLRIIDEIKREFAKSVDAGGGHALAAGMKIADQSEKHEIMKSLIKKFG